MRYVVAADVPDADRSDVYLHESVVAAVRDLIGLRSRGLGYTFEIYPSAGPEPSHRGHIASLPEPKPLAWLQVETSEEAYDAYLTD